LLNPVGVRRMKCVWDPAFHAGLLSFNPFRIEYRLGNE
jgi:hypothetical protein